MHEFTTDYIKEFAEKGTSLYNVFFKRFPFFKPLIINTLIYGSNNYVLIITDKSKPDMVFSIYGSSEGILVKTGFDKDINIRFTLERSIIEDITDRYEVYRAKPLKLIKYLMTYFTSMNIDDPRIFQSSLKGERVYLRPYRESDIRCLLQWYNDYELNKLAGWTSKEVTADRLRYGMSKSFGDDPMNLMIDEENGMPIGTIQLYEINERDKNCLLGIRIGSRDHMNKGYGADAVRTILQYAFMKMDMYRVTLRVYEYNERALRCYLKCGFKVEGRTRKSAFIDGQYYDEIVMGILKSEFLST